MAQLLDDLKRRMDQALEQLRKELGGLRTGRANAGMLEPLMVEAYETKMPITQVAAISTPEPRSFSIQVYDKGVVKAVEKAIADSGLGLNPQTEGNVIRIHLPSLTQERRAELGKLAGKYAEAARVSVRNVRRDGMEQVKKQQKDKQIGEDEQKGLEHKIQQLTDSEIKKIDELLANKEKEIMQV